MDEGANPPAQQSPSDDVLGSHHRQNAIRRLTGERLDVLIVGAGESVPSVSRHSRDVWQEGLRVGPC